ncbi:putative hydrolase [Moritella sp. JT01]|uniref:alpha/beta fold hydrolase n=1 Tax=Moritella sp. JT01 TaxID=756698 RepID=UPI000791F02B|nr:alpha/beta fold hydrolase [Moritella sp. JT01]KXO08552.1 putative hydrolase [Moritella sp. JT01]
MNKVKFIFSQLLLGLVFSPQVFASSVYSPMSEEVECPEGSSLNTQCYYLTVPKDYSLTDNKPEDTVNLFYTVTPAKNEAERIGSLIFNFGGPGVPGSLEAMEMVNDLARWNQAYPKVGYNKVNEYFDVVGFDPRGTGGSAFAEEIADCALSSEGCDKTFQSIAPYMGTNTTAKDLESLRIALHEEQISYIGYSYGTRLGAVYADMYPEHVRSFVLDSAMDPALTNANQLYYSSLEGFNKALRIRLKRSNRDVSGDMSKLRWMMSRFENVDFFSTADGAVLEKKHFITLLDALRSVDIDGKWESVKEPLFQLLDNDEGVEFWSVIDQLQKKAKIEQEEWKFQYDAVHRAIVCTDEHIKKERSENEFMNKSAVFGQTVYQNNAGMCQGWSAKTDPIRKIEETGTKLMPNSVMIVAAKNDPVTPYKWSKKMYNSFEQSAELLTINKKIEHGLIFSFNLNPKADKKVIHFLLDSVAMKQ